MSEISINIKEWKKSILQIFQLSTYILPVTYNFNLATVNVWSDMP